MGFIRRGPRNTVVMHVLTLCVNKQTCKNLKSRIAGRPKLNSDTGFGNSKSKCPVRNRGRLSCKNRFYGAKRTLLLDNRKYAERNACFRPTKNVCCARTLSTLNLDTVSVGRPPLFSPSAPVRNNSPPPADRLALWHVGRRVWVYVVCVVCCGVVWCVVCVVWLWV
jgi:hypothetical protein